MDYISAANPKTPPTLSSFSASISNKRDEAVANAVAAAVSVLVAFTQIVSFSLATPVATAVVAVIAAAIATATAIMAAIGMVEAVASESGDLSPSTERAIQTLQALKAPITAAIKALEKSATGDSNLTESIEAAKDLFKAIDKIETSKNPVEIKANLLKAEIAVIKISKAVKSAANKFKVDDAVLGNFSPQHTIFGPGREPTDYEDLGPGKRTS